jgi:hypothetical protein
LLTHTIAGTVSPEVAAGKYKVGLWIADNQERARDNAAYAVKFAPDNGVVSHWTDAARTRTVNIIGEVNL